MSFGKTIQLFLTDGTADGVAIASMRNWTGKLLVGRSSSLKQLLDRPELAQPGIYVLEGPDPKIAGATRIYIGEGEVTKSRLQTHAKTKDFWERACVVTVTDESLTKGHIQYLESRLIDMARAARRVQLDNGTSPEASGKPLPESDRADMELFLEHLANVLPVVGFDFLKPLSKPTSTGTGTVFEIYNKKRGVGAKARDEDGDLVVLKGSHALAKGGYANNSYAALRQQLIDAGILQPTDNPDLLKFIEDTSFSSPSAAASVVFDRNTNGRNWWKVAGTKVSYHEWQLGDESE